MREPAWRGRRRSCTVIDRKGAMDILEYVTEQGQGQFERALRKREDSFRALADNVPDPIVRFNRKFQYVYANPAAERMAGLPAGDMLGRTSEEIGVARELALRWHRLIERVFETGAHEELEFELDTGDGLRCFQSRLVPERASDGHVDTVLVVTRDVTRIRQSESALRVHTRRLEIMHRIYQSIFTAQSPEEVGVAALRHIYDLAPCRWASVAILDCDAQAFRVVASWHSEGVSCAPIQPGREYWIGPAASALKAAGAVEQIDALCGASEFMTQLREFGMTRMLPLIARGELIGLLTLALISPEGFTEDAGLVLSEVAAQLALALEDMLLVKSVREQREQLHRLAARMSEAQETERRRLAIELHDRVGQNLTALGINLNIVRSLLPQDQMPRLGPKLDTAMSLLEETIERIRDVNSDLRPPVLDDYGLLAALRWFCQRFTERTGLETVVQGREPHPRLEQMAEIGLFRIAQEALTNAAKHARATSVVVQYEEDRGVVRLAISDDGVGFDPSTYRSSERRPGWGLIGMQERAEAVGGRLRIESRPGAGTRVLVSITR